MTNPHAITMLDWLVILGWLLVYLMPALIAQAREHHNWVAILVLNIATGWTGIMWLVCLVWACTWVRPRADRGR